MDLDGLLIETEARVLVGEELFDLETLITLELDHLTHALGLGVADDCAIASCIHVSLLVLRALWGGGRGEPGERTKFLLDDLENLLVVKLARDALYSGQGLASITLCDVNP